MPRETGYRLHKPTGQAYVYLSGRMFYLGKHGTPESREKYERLKAEWLKNRHAGKFAPSSAVTMAQVCLAYRITQKSTTRTVRSTSNCV